MSCFDNFIGIKGDCTTTEPPVTGLYINDLAGISLRFAAHIANDETMTGVNLLKEKINFAIKLVKSDVIKFFAPYMRINTNIDFNIGGAFNSAYLSPAPLSRGLLISKNEKSKIQKIYLNHVDVLVNTTGNHTLVLQDIYTTINYNFSAIAGQVKKINLNYLAEGTEVYLLMDNSALSVNEGNILYQQSCGCNWKTYKPTESQLSIKGYNGTGTDSKTYGLRANVSVICDVDSILCSLTRELGLIVLYRAGIAILEEQLVSDRLNEYVVFNDKEMTKDFLKMWGNEYNGRLDTLAMSSKQTLKQLNDSCIDCGGMKYGYSI